MNEIEKFIQDLTKEVQESKKDAHQEEQLLRLQEVAKTYSGEDKIISSLEILEKIKNSPERKYIKTGFTDLDTILGGFLTKQLVVISAPTKSGKTSFCVDITSYLKDLNPMWLPFEETAEELIMKFVERKETPPLFYTPERITGNTLTWVEKKIIEAKAKYDSKIIFIDHLHFIVDMGDNMSVQIGRTMRELKQVAKKWDVVIVLIAHLKKTKMETQPDLEDLRDSSFIAQEADTVIMLRRETKRNQGKVELTNNVNVSVQANRATGKTGNVSMVFENGRFLQREWQQEEDEILTNW